MNTDDRRHGTYAGGRVHRKTSTTVCEPCRRAEARYEQERQLDILAGRARRVPARGSQLRIRALVALGHDFTRIGEALGMTGSGAWALAHRDRAFAWATTAAKVTSLYEAWSMALPPETTLRERKATAYARTVATKHGWAVPLAWDDIDNDLEPHGERSAATPVRIGEIDDVVVHRILAGALVPANTAERREVVRRWPSTGRPLSDLVEITGWKVERYHQEGTAA